MKAARKAQRKEDNLQRERRRKVEARGRKPQKRRKGERPKRRALLGHLYQVLSDQPRCPFLFSSDNRQYRKVMPSLKLMHTSKRMLALFHVFLDLYGGNFFSINQRIRKKAIVQGRLGEEAAAAAATTLEENKLVRAQKRQEKRRALSQILKDSVRVTRRVCLQNTRQQASTGEPNKARRRTERPHS